MSKPNKNSITVAATCSKNPGLEFKGIDTHSKITIFRASFDGGNVATGNFLAIVTALRVLQRNKIEMDAIYSDSEEAINWVKNKKCSDPPRDGRKREKLAEAVDEAEEWLRTNSYKSEILKWDEEEWGDVHVFISRYLKKV